VSEFFTLLLQEAESGWVWMYTAGMPGEARAGRVAELDSDAWEHETQARERRERFGLQFLYRAILGVPADLGWRLERGRAGVERRNWLELLVASLLAIGLLVALPVSGLILPNADLALNRHGELSVFPIVHALLVILLLILPGVLVIDRWPVAGGLLVIIGCFCLMALFWWLREAMVVIVLGAAAAAAAAIRLYRMPRA
jgi:hypothetical protein